MLEGRTRRKGEGGDSDSPATMDNECIRRRRDMLQFSSVPLSSRRCVSYYHHHHRRSIHPSSSFVSITIMLARRTLTSPPDRPPFCLRATKNSSRDPRAARSPSRRNVAQSLFPRVLYIPSSPTISVEDGGGGGGKMRRWGDECLFNQRRNFRH